MTQASSTPPLAIVIPARDAEDLLAECLPALTAQLRPDDSLVVVDDASRDGTAALAESFGAQVIRRPTAAGPYAARNDGWRATSQPYVLFTDARCIAQDGLLARIREAAVMEPDLICSEIVVRRGERIAERVAAERQHLRVAYYESDTFLPFFPTACLAVRRRALEDVNGFRILDSGGDADLCWRIQLAGHRNLAEIREPLMEWRPRRTVRSLVRQWAKYGRSNAQLRHEYQAHGATAPAPLPTARLVAIYTRRALRTLHRRQIRDAPVVLVDALVNLAQDVAYGRTTRSLRKGP